MASSNVLTMERIAEIAADGMCTMEVETAELIRLARLGLRVESAPVVQPHTLGKDADGDFEVKCSTTADDLRRVPIWQRVALVALDA